MPRPPFSNPDAVRLIRQMAAEGASKARITAAVRITPKTLDKVLAREGIAMPPNPGGRPKKSAPVVVTIKSRSTKPKKPDTLCATVLCLRPVLARGLCSKCYRAEPEPEVPEETDQALALKAALALRRPNVLAVAKLVWGHALSEDANTLRLRGRPITFQELLKRTNGWLRENGHKVMEAGG